MKKQRKILFAHKNNAKLYLHVVWAFDNCQLLDAPSSFVWASYWNHCLAAL